MLCFIEENAQLHRGSEDGDFQEFLSLPETQDVDNDTGVDRDYQEEVQDSGMDAGIESDSDGDGDEDMIVLDPEHVSFLKPRYKMRINSY